MADAKQNVSVKTRKVEMDTEDVGARGGAAVTDKPL